MGRWYEYQQPARTIVVLIKGRPMSTAPSGGIDVHFGEFNDRYSPLFHTHSRVETGKSLQYFKGLIQAKKKNMEWMAEAVPFSDDQALQPFFSFAPKGI